MNEIQNARAGKLPLNIMLLHKLAVKMETRRRTILKAIIWNVIGLLSMSAIGFFVTGSVALGGGIAVINTLVGLIFYLAYERIWVRINWGRHV